MTEVQRRSRKLNQFYKKATFTTSHFQRFFKGNIETSNKSNQITKDTKKKLKLIRRKHRNHGYLEETAKGGLEALFSIEFLSWVLKILLQLKCSSLCGGLTANDNDSWQPRMVMGGEGRVSRVWWEFGERERWKICFSPLMDLFIVCKSRLVRWSRWANYFLWVKLCLVSRLG